MTPLVVCPNCHHELHDFTSAGFCEACGQRLVVVDGSDGSRKRNKKLGITVSEVIAFALFFIARSNGADFITAFVIFIVISMVGVGLMVLWHRAVKPTGIRLREEGLVGVAKAGEKKLADLIEPVLYGKQGKNRDNRPPKSQASSH